MKLIDLKEEDKLKIIENMGWTATSISPLTIEDDYGNFAVGIAANYLLDALILEYDPSNMEDYLIDVKLMTESGYIPHTIKRLSDGTKLSLNENNTYSFDDMPLEYVWGKEYKISDPLYFRVNTWIKKT